MKNLLLLMFGTLLAAGAAGASDGRIPLIDFRNAADAKFAINDFGKRKNWTMRHDPGRGCLVYSFTNLRSHVVLPVLDERLKARAAELQPDTFYVKYRAPEYEATTFLKLFKGRDPHVANLPVTVGTDMNVAVAHARVAWSRGARPYVPTEVTYCVIAPEGTGTLEIYEVGIVNRKKGPAAKPRDPTPVPADAFAVFPEPREWRLADGAFPLPQRWPWRARDLPSAARADFADELREFHGIELVEGETDATLSFELVRELGSVKYDGFSVSCTEKGVVVKALEPAGLAYASRTLAELVWRAGGKRLPHFELRDWPRFAIRPWIDSMLCHPGTPKYEVGFYNRMLSRFVLASRYNRIGHYRADTLEWSWPTIPKQDNAWSQADYAAIVDYVNGYGVRMLPSVQSLGHQDYCICGGSYWQTRANAARYGEDGNRSVLCTRNPEATKALFSQFDDMIRLCSRNPQYKPDYFLTWHDEVRWQTHDVPESNRCVRCAGVPKNRLFLESVVRCRDRLKRDGLTEVIFTDMISEAHSGRDRFNCADIVDEIPRDVVLASWSALTDLSISDFRKRGFRNWRLFTGYSAGTDGYDDVEAQGIGLYAYRWWLTDARMGVAPQIQYGHLVTCLQSYYAWREAPRDPEERQLMVRKYGPFLMRGWSRRPLRGKGPERDLGIDPVSAGDMPVKLPVSGLVASLVFTHGADLKESDREAFFDRHTIRETIAGPDVAACRIVYADGAETLVPMRYGWNVGAIRSDGRSYKELLARYLADCRRVIPNADDTAVRYEYEWSNPHPEKRIVAAELVRPHKTLARYRLFSLSAAPALQ